MKFSSSGPIKLAQKFSIEVQLFDDTFQAGPSTLFSYICLGEEIES